MKPQTPAETVTYVIVALFAIAVVIGFFDRSFQMPPSLATVTGIAVGGLTGYAVLKRGEKADK